MPYEVGTFRCVNDTPRVANGIPLAAVRFVKSRRLPFAAAILAGGGAAISATGQTYVLDPVGLGDPAFSSQVGVR